MLSKSLGSIDMANIPFISLELLIFKVNTAKPGFVPGIRFIRCSTIKGRIQLFRLSLAAREFVLQSGKSQALDSAAGTLLNQLYELPA
jgi:hypothetical protein